MTSRELLPKRFELLSELVPHARAMALLINPNSPISALMISDAQGAASVIGVQLHILKAGAEGEFDAAFASLFRCKSTRSSSLVTRSSTTDAMSSWRWPPDKRSQRFTNGVSSSSPVG